MRTVSLVNRLKWSFAGNMNPHALELGDVDNDGDIEFVIGNLNGELAVFKGECPLGTPTFTCQELGTITCIAIGDVRNVGKNSIVVINAEGHCHIFDIPPPNTSQPTSQPTTPPVVSHTQRQNLVDEYLRQGRRPSDSTNSSRRMMAQTEEQTHRPSEDGGRDGPSIQNLQQPKVTLKVPVNVNKILIADIDGDGLNELILARTDRILHSFQLDYQCGTVNDKPDTLTQSTPTSTATLNNSPTSTLTSTIQSSLSALSGNKLVSKLNNENKELKSHVLRKGMVWKSGRTKDLKGNNNTKLKSTDTLPKSTWDQQVYLKDKDMWVFDGQITSLTTTTYPDRPNEPILLVAQPGNTFTIIDQKGNRLNRDFTPQHGPYLYDQRQREIVKQHEDEEDGDPSDTTTTKKIPQSKINPAIAITTEPTLSEPMDINRPTTSESKDTSTSTIRTLLNRFAIPNDINVDSVIYTKEDEDDSNDNDDENEGDDGNNNDTDSERTNRMIQQDWSLIDGDDIMGDDKIGAVATNIVVGKRHVPIDHQKNGNEIGMLSMDGKFTVYDLRTRKASQQDLFVTHKLFSLATLNVSGTPMLPKSLYPARNAPLYFAGSPQPQNSSRQQQQQQQQHQPQQNHQHHHTFTSRHPSLASATSSPSSSGRAMATTATTTAVAHSNTGSPSFSASSKLSFTISNSNNNNNNTRMDEVNKSQSLNSPATPHHTQQDTNIPLQQEIVTGSDFSGIHASDNHSTISKSAITKHGYYDDNNNNLLSQTVNSSRRGSLSSNGSSWNDLDQDDDDDEGPDCDLFVACAWNGVTYLIDWSQRLDDDMVYHESDTSSSDSDSDSIGGDERSSSIRFQLVKFAFEGRVCAFTAGLYAVAPGYNVPCLFYVDFEDQIFVYFDVRIAPGKVTGFIDMIDDDVEEALDRLLGLEDDLIKAMASNSGKQHQQQQQNEDDGQQEHQIDLGDGWKGIMDDTVSLDSLTLNPNGQLDLTDFIHECLYEFDDMKDRLENDLFVFEHEHLPHTITNHSDIRRLSDLNITIEPELESEVSEAEDAMEEQGIFAYDDTRSTQSSDSEILRNWMDENLLRSNIGS